MEDNSLKKTVGSISMPEEMRRRILVNCKMAMNKKQEGKFVKMKKGFRWPAIVAAVLALCICIPVAGVAAGNSGLFRDVMRGTAVVGTEYVQATGEIRATGEYAGGKMTVKAVFLTPDKVPFSEIEKLAVGSCRIVDGAGRTAAEFDGSEAVAIAAGQAVMVLPAQELVPGDYVLKIDAFVGSKKAEQDLPLKGSWECAFTVG